MTWTWPDREPKLICALRKNRFRLLRHFSLNYRAKRDEMLPSRPSTSLNNCPHCTSHSSSKPRPTLLRTADTTLPGTARPVFSMLASKHDHKEVTYNCRQALRPDTSAFPERVSPAARPQQPHVSGRALPAPRISPRSSPPRRSWTPPRCCSPPWPASAGRTRRCPP